MLKSLDFFLINVFQIKSKNFRKKLRKIKINKSIRIFSFIFSNSIMHSIMYIKPTSSKNVYYGCEAYLRFNLFSLY